MKQLVVWILQTGEPLHIDAGSPRPMRAMNLADALIAKGHRVVLWSSAFYHQEKRHRSLLPKTIHVSSQLEIRLIPSPGYKNNIGLARLWDHAVLAYRLKNYLKMEKMQPDVAFIGFPPIEAAAVMSNWLKKRAVPFLVDVKDQWPAVFIDALPKPLKSIGRLLLTPYFYLAKRSMSDATGLTAMAGGFLGWAASFTGRNLGKNDCVVPLVAPNAQVTAQELELAGAWWDQQGIKADGTSRVMFVGSHSPVFDIEPIYETAIKMLSLGMNCQFIICGSGTNTDTWRARMAGLKNVYFPGWIDRAKIEVLASRSIAALAPYSNRDDAVLSIPNKILDSMQLGLPILSPLLGEVASLINLYKIGLHYNNKPNENLFECLNRLIINKNLQFEISANARNLYANQYSYEFVYNGLVLHLKKISQRNIG